MEPTPPDLIVSFLQFNPSHAAGRVVGGVAHLVLVRPMRFTPSIVILAASVTTSCVALVDGSWVSGSKRAVSPDDIRAAVAVSRIPLRERKAMMPSRPRQIDVVSEDEIHVYWYGLKANDASYVIAKRIAGQWRYDNEVIIISDPIGSNHAIEPTAIQLYA
jgi:hypothetical protein